MRKLYKWTWRHGKLNCLFVGNVSDLYATKLCSSISISFQNNLSIFCSSMNTFREIKLSNGVFATCEFVSFPSTPLLWQDSNDSIQNIYIKWITKTTLKIKIGLLVLSSNKMKNYLLRICYSQDLLEIDYYAYLD